MPVFSKPRKSLLYALCALSITNNISDVATYFTIFLSFFFYGSWLRHLISFIFNISFLFKKIYIYINIAPRHKVIDNNLSIKEVTLDDGGLYVCRATQSNPMIADFREMNITLKIQRKCAHPRLHFSPCIDFFFFFSSNCFFKKTKLFLCKWKLVDRELRTQMSRAGSRITRKRLTVLLEAQSTWLAPPWQSRAPISFGSKITGRCIQATTSKSLIPIITARSSSTFTTSPSLVITSAEPPTCWAPWPASSF